jgi:hypothetical protein
VRKENSCKGGIEVLRKKKELPEGERSAIISKELHRRAGSLHILHTVYMREGRAVVCGNELL